MMDLSQIMPKLRRLNEEGRLPDLIAAHANAKRSLALPDALQATYMDLEARDLALAAQHLLGVDFGEAMDAARDSLSEPPARRLALEMIAEEFIAVDQVEVSAHRRALERAQRRGR